MYFDYVIVGAGPAGSVAANRLAQDNTKKILIIEQRNHIAGNCFDEYDANGVLIHKYGPHIFHTKEREVWDFLSQFTDWHLYQHKVLGLAAGKFIPIPFNLNSLRAIFPKTIADKMEEKIFELYTYGSRITIGDLQQIDEPVIKQLADFIYGNIFLNYTIKQWNIQPDALSPDVINRVPVLLSYDDRYFQDKYQGMPVSGYTKMFERMLDMPNIKLLLNTDYKEVINDITYNTMIYSGPVDYYFDYHYGPLDYRSIDFVFDYYPQETYQAVTTVNYPNNYNFTRITDFKQMTMQKVDGCTIVKEFPGDYTPGENIPYYPVLNQKNIDNHKKYEALVQNLDNVVFLGRLAEYRYYNMDQIILKSLKKAESLMK